ncbi:hypothetical protein NG799_22080 [Laspinema sp. D1]|uniref:Uncharacterized protein n=1 Tax=Laspinema palackyanum D2a TaxID=2953684 RepID=A0ABT2MW70_9CYAN|nr:hypothetical protein [Laspinema sp. D2a]
MAKIEDKTQAVIPYLKGKLNGYRVDKGLTIFSDKRSTTLGITTGYTDRARGSGEIVSIDLASGSLHRIDAEVAGIPIIWAADITFTLRYKANSHGERWVYPGGAWVDNIWGSANSAGTIKATLKFKPQSPAVLVLDIQVDPDADNRPGNFVKDYIAPLFRDAIDNALEQFTNLQIS